MECHARADYAGAFKLVRVTGFEVGPQSTKANMRATASQLKKDDPLNSPLLVKALAAHGGMRQPAFATRQAVAFRVLESWVQIATPPAVSPMAAPAQPVLPESPPAPAIPPARALADPPAAVPVIPPATETPAPRVDVPALGASVDTQPAVPGAPIQVPLPPVDLNPVALPPATPPEPPGVIVPVAPAAEVKPAIPELAPLPVAPAPTPVVKPAGASAVPLVLPTPPNMPAMGDGAKLPKHPAAGGAGSSFGTQAPPKPATTTKPSARDEFDPDAFNKGR
jgi:hypothetical protein